MDEIGGKVEGAISGDAEADDLVCVAIQVDGDSFDVLAVERNDLVAGSGILLL